MDLDRLTDEEIADQYPHGICDLCESALDFSAEDGEFCPVCEARKPLEASPVRASFALDTTTGAVRWSGWSAP